MENVELNSSTTSIPGFAELLPDTQLVAVLNKAGISSPTPVQAAALPGALRGGDMIVQARTGSGKTLAYALPLLVRLRSQAREAEQPRHTTALILAPTRELASQICEVFNRFSGIEPARLIGGLPVGGQIRQLREDPRIVVGTPGRILDLLQQRELSLGRCEYVVVDEVDEMLSLDFEEDVRRILKNVPERRQGLFVSATMTPKVEAFAREFLKNYETVRIVTGPDEMPPIEHTYYEMAPGVTAKAQALCDLLEVINPRSAIIFCNTKRDTELVEVYLRRRGFNARLINSDLTQRQREFVMDRIRGGELRLLIGTDIAARGIDIEQLDLVVNYSLPEQPEVYVHRTGRTARAGRDGLAVSLIGPEDFGAFQNIKRVVKATLEPRTLPLPEAVAGARLTRYLGILESSDISIDAKDSMVATRLLQQLGEVQQPAEPLVDTVARLLHDFVEQHTLRSQITLDEEMRIASGRPRNDDAEGEQREPQHHERHRDGGRGGYRGRGRRSGGRGR